MLRLVFLMALMLTACGREGRYVDPALQPAVDRYFANAPTKGHWRQVEAVEFGHTSGTELGDCERDRILKRTTKRRVVISDSLKSESGSFLAAVVAHELAHCLHDKGHRESGLMSANIESRSNEYWDERLDEEIREIF